MPAQLCDVLQISYDRLSRAGIESARLDARLLIAHALGIDASSLVLARPIEISDADVSAIDALVARREKKEPVSRIVGEREFWSLPFRITAATLDPRPDTETLVQTALEVVKEYDVSPLHIIDVGVGSGCILLSLLSEWPNAFGLGIDVSVEALEVARHNACALGLSNRTSFITADWLSGIEGQFDLIVSNPPYISVDEAEALPREVKEFDPDLALYGGVDGLDAYRTLAPESLSRLRRGGMLLLEIGHAQRSAVADILSQNGYRDISVHKDLAGRSRCVSAFAD